MKKLLYFLFILLLAPGIAAAQDDGLSLNQVNGLANEAKKAVEEAEDDNPCPENKEAAHALAKKIFDARDQIEAYLDAPRTEKQRTDGEKALEKVKELIPRIKELCPGAYVADKFKQFCDELADEARKDYDGAKETSITNFLDEMKAAADEQAEANPCDSADVINPLHDAITERAANPVSEGEPVPGFINDHFPISGRKHETPPEELIYNLRFTGRTTGHIATITVTNPTDQPMQFTIPQFYIPGTNGHQPQATDRVITVSVGPGQTVDKQVYGYCTRVDKEAPTAGSTRSLLGTVTFRPPTPAGGINGKPGWSSTTDVDLVDPATGQPLNATINFDEYPDQSWFAFEVLDRLSADYDRLLASGEIDPKFGSSPEEKKFNYVQQAFWEIMATVHGFDYTYEDFLENGIRRVEETYDITYEELSHDEQAEITGTFRTSWTDISLVGGGMKINSDQ